jgi:hypothetical protein
MTRGNARCPAQTVTRSMSKSSREVAAGWIAAKALATEDGSEASQA